MPPFTDEQFKEFIDAIQENKHDREMLIRIDEIVKRIDISLREHITREEGKMESFQRFQWMFAGVLALFGIILTLSTIGSNLMSFFNAN